MHFGQQSRFVCCFFLYDRFLTVTQPRVPCASTLIKIVEILTKTSLGSIKNIIPCVTEIKVDLLNSRYTNFGLLCTSADSIALSSARLRMTHCTSRNVPFSHTSVIYLDRIL